MGLSTKQVPDQLGLDWSESLMQSSTLDLPKPPPARRNQQQQQQQQHSERLECPRCASTNTKFCYYNNYNKSQPRHYCKACKRHWTKGGTLRNVPVGGGRKNKRVKVSKTATSTSNMASETVPKGSTIRDAHVFSQSQQDGCNLPLGALSDQKSISDTLFQAMYHPPSSLQNDAINSFLGKTFMVSNGTFSGSTLMPSQDQSIQFSFSNTDASSITTPCQKSNAYDHIGSLETSLESTITTIVPTTSGSLSQPWQDPTPSGAMDVPNYWSWNDIDSLVSADDDITWNNTGIKF